MGAETPAAMESSPVAPILPLNGMSRSESVDGTSTDSAPLDPQDKLDLMREEWLAGRARNGEIDIRE